MFKTYVVDFAFGMVERISLGLKAFFGGNGSDHAAGWIMLVCLIVAALVCVMFSGRPSARRLALIPGLPLALIAASLVFAWAAHPAIEIKNWKTRAGGGKALVVRLDENTVRTIEGGRWWVVGTSGRLGALPALKTPPFRDQAHGVLQVERDGGGRFCLKGSLLYFSTVEDDSSSSQTAHWIVVERPGMGAAAGLFRVIALAAGIVVLGARLFWLMAFPLPGLLRSPVFAAIAVLFAISFGAHQMRFIKQDHRMHLVTSREDDAYMMERLEKCAQLKSMDPAATDNNAYGAAGYYPYAFLPAAAGLLGRSLSAEWLTLHVRGLKLLASLAMLAVVWCLAARHFGRAEAVAATVCTATWCGFLKYSSYPFYPDVLTAAFSLLSLHHILSLHDGWDDRRLALATAAAAFAVSIKFLSFLLFPLLFLSAVLSALRKFKGRPGRMAGFLAIRAAAMLALCLAAFFLCNPYLDYNLNWIVPNMKMAHTYYSTDTPNVVAGGSASFSTWLQSAWMTGGDFFFVLAAVLCIAAAAVAGARLAARGLGDVMHGRRPLFAGAGQEKSAVVFLFIAGYSLYIHFSITLPSAIDERLILVIYPLVLILAAQAVRMAWPLLELSAGRGGQVEGKPGLQTRDAA